MTNKIVEEIQRLTGGIILNEDEKQVNLLPLFNTDKIHKTELHDCELIQILSKENEDIAIYGPTRKVHFGKRMHEVLSLYNGQELRDKMFDIILTVNYKLPEFEQGSIMQVGNSEDDQKLMKLLTNSTGCIIDKYDYILFNTTDEKIIMITNEILNSILPSNWTLVDEFTVIAPIIDQDEWSSLLMNAKKHDLWDKYNEN